MSVIPTSLIDDKIIRTAIGLQHHLPENDKASLHFRWTQNIEARGIAANRFPRSNDWQEIESHGTTEILGWHSAITDAERRLINSPSQKQ